MKRPCFGYFFNNYCCSLVSYRPLPNAKPVAGKKAGKNKLVLSSVSDLQTQFTAVVQKPETRKMNEFLKETIFFFIFCFWHRPHVSGNLWKRKFFFTNTACVHTYPAYFPAVSGNFWKRSPEWKFFYPIRIRIRVNGRIRKISNTLSSFSWIQSSRRAL